jgi:hypothetical protein
VDPGVAQVVEGQPSASTAVASVTAAGVKEQPFDIDITSIFNGWVSGGTPNRGLRLETSSTAAGGRSFYSMNATGTKAQFRPVVLIEVSRAPDAPVDIVPSGGAVVSVSDPVVSWRYGGDGVAAMAAYQVLTFAEGTSSTPDFSERFASFNYNGIDHQGTWASRKAGIISTMFNSGAAVIGCQEANSTSSPDQPGQIVAGLNAASGSSGQWQSFIGPNLNVIFVDTAVFTPLWTKTKDVALGVGKYASALLLQHVTSGARVTYWTTHYLPGDENEDQRKAATAVLIPWLATLGPRVGGGDLNNHSSAAAKPVGMLNLSGNVEFRSLVDTVTNGTYNSLDGYDTNPMEGFWIDHLFVSGGPAPTAVGLIDSGTASDHNLVYADIDYAATVTDVGAPSGDTGEVASTVPQYQMSGISGRTPFMIRHKSSEGRWSPYSELQVLGYAPKMTLTITSTESTTDDPSPTTTWTVDGIQTAYRVLYVDADTGATIVDSGQQTGDANQWSPAAPLDVSSSISINRVVRVWDDVNNRVATPGDTVYVEAVAGPFSIVPTSDVGPVASLVASTPLGPIVELDWTRSSGTPDSWIIERRIDSQPWTKFAVEVGDTALGGSAFRWRDVTAPPEHDLTYRVSAVVNSRQGTATTASTIRPHADFIWLADPDDPTWLLPVAGDDAGTWALGEDSSIVNVLGSDRSLLIHEGFRGYEGSISGLFVSAVPQMGGTTAQQQRDASWRLKEQPTKTWRLVLGDMNIPVVVRNVTPVPRPGAEIMFGFAFDFFQQGLPWVEAA